MRLVSSSSATVTVSAGACNECGFARSTVSLEEVSDAARCAAGLPSDAERTGNTGSLAWRHKSGIETDLGVGVQRVDSEELVVAFASVLFNQACAWRWPSVACSSW